MNPPTLLPLVARLKACPAHQHRISEKGLRETWQCFREINLEHGDSITPAIMAALILYDEASFAGLLSSAEHAQMSAAAKSALARYQQLTHPPNKLGKLLAGTIKKESI